MHEKEFIPTDEQKRILDITEGVHLVLAPPGSGKTELLAQRVFTAKKNGYDDDDIICLTFTNRAAKGMKDRIKKIHPDNEILIGNIHHFCSKFLFENRLIPLNTSILDEEEANQLMSEFREAFEYAKDDKIYIPDLLKLATYLRQKELGFPEVLFQKPKLSQIPDPWKAKEVCEAYNNEKQINNYLDFDDLLTLTYNALRGMRKDNLLMSKFKWLQIDEVQDLNPLQWSIVNEITMKDALIVYFGDYEQAIFSFMGAKLDSLHSIEKVIQSNSKNSIHNLLKNFRSPSYLLNIYVKYARSNWTPSWKKPPVATSDEAAPADSLRIFGVNGTAYSEAKYISEHLIPSLLNEDERTAIIVRFNTTAETFSRVLNEVNIPHFKISGFDLFRRRTVKGLLAFFSIFLNEFDRLSWARVFYEFRGIESLKESRAFINSMKEIGLTPVDLLKYQGTSSRLIEFFKIFKEGEMIIFDTETTGLDTLNDDIIQIAAVRIVEGKLKETFEVFINTEKDISESEKVHHISREHLDRFGVSPQKGLIDFLNFCGPEATLVAHNIGYDDAILTSNLIRFCNIQLDDYCREKFDSITLTKLIHPDLQSYKLGFLIETLQFEGENSHNALDDVKATFSLLEKLNASSNKHINLQNEFLSDIKNNSLIVKFNSRFKEIHNLFSQISKHELSLDKATSLYFEHHYKLFMPANEEAKRKYLEEQQKDMSEIDKLISHMSFYANSEKVLTLKDSIELYIPEYRMFKESDLYLGNEKVVISTVYKAKGLEFENVIVAEATDNEYPCLWPLKDASESEKEAAILEDARAFYVALTRTKKRLFISYHDKSSYGHTKDRSRFIECIQEYFQFSQE